MVKAAEEIMRAIVYETNLHLHLPLLFFLSKCIFFITHINLKNTIIYIFIYELKTLHVSDTRILNGDSQKPALNVLFDFLYAL